MKVKIKVKVGRRGDGEPMYAAVAWSHQTESWQTEDAVLTDDLINMDAAQQGTTYTVVADIPDPAPLDGGEVKGEVEK